MEAIYDWLDREAQQHEDRELADLFRAEPLILVPERGWFSVGAVCWEDPTGRLPALAPPLAEA